MKRKLLTLTAIAALSLPAAAFAQTTNTLLSGSELEGAEVRNLQNQDVGDIEEILLDPSSGRVRFAVLNVGGFLGLGETHVAVPWNAFRVTKEGSTAKIVLDATKERLEKAPRVEGKKYDRLYTRQDAEPTFVYWGITWYDIDPVSTASPGASPKSSPTATASPSPVKR